MVMCSKGAERKCGQWVEEEDYACASSAFQSYGWILEVVLLFKYLGRVLTASDDYCPELVYNFRKS